jgi:antitoxin (DNA-binding transcriptional repressor) of toxin-antitoxin stability system
MIQAMETVKATQLKNRLGAVLARAALSPVAIERHGHIVAYLIPASAQQSTRLATKARTRQGWDRGIEERVVELAARGDFRPSRWLRAGDSRLLAGISVILASHERFNRTRMLALAERLHPGMSAPQNFGAWLRTTPVLAERFLALLDARLRELKSAA